MYLSVCRAIDKPVVVVMDNEQLEALRLEQLMALWPANRTPEQQQEVTRLSMRVRKRRSRSLRSGSGDLYPINYHRNFIDLHANFNEELQRCVQALNLRYPIVLFHHFNSARSNLMAITKSYAFETLRHFFFGGLAEKTKNTTFWKATCNHPDYGYGKRIVNQSILSILDDLRFLDNKEVCRGDTGNCSLPDGVLMVNKPSNPFARYLYSFTSRYTVHEPDVSLNFREISLLEKWFEMDRQLLNKICARDQCVREYINEKIFMDGQYESDLGVFSEITFNDYFHFKFGLYISFHREENDSLVVSFTKTQLIAAIRITMNRIRSRRYRVKPKKRATLPRWFDAPITPPNLTPDLSNETEVIDIGDDSDTLETEANKETNTETNTSKNFTDFSLGGTVGCSKEVTNERSACETKTSDFGMDTEEEGVDVSGFESKSWEEALVLVDALDNFEVTNQSNELEELRVKTREDRFLDEQELMIDELWMNCGEENKPRDPVEPEPVTNEVENRVAQNLDVLSHLRTNSKTLEEIVTVLREHNSPREDSMEETTRKHLTQNNKRKAKRPRKVINVTFELDAQEIEKRKKNNHPPEDPKILVPTALSNVRLPVETSVFKVSMRILF